MSELAWFRLLLRGIGVLVVLQLTPGLIGYLAYLPDVLGGGGWASPRYAAQIFASISGYGLSLGLGLYLIFGGSKVMRLCTRDLIGRCPVCDYPLTKIVGSVCPECGVPIRGHTDQLQNDKPGSRPESE